MIIPLTEKQKAIIVGNILGDGGMYTNGSGGKNSYFYISNALSIKNIFIGCLMS